MRKLKRPEDPDRLTITGLWKKESKSGKGCTWISGSIKPEYLQKITSYGNEALILVLPNYKKRNPRDPDMYLYVTRHKPRTVSKTVKEQVEAINDDQSSSSDNPLNISELSEI
jgi:hypothetical protein